jgi:hypothetical protein
MMRWPTRVLAGQGAVEMAHTVAPFSRGPVRWTRPPTGPWPTWAVASAPGKDRGNHYPPWDPPCGQLRGARPPLDLAAQLGPHGPRRRGDHADRDSPLACLVRRNTTAHDALDLGLASAPGQDRGNHYPPWGPLARSVRGARPLTGPCGPTWALAGQGAVETAHTVAPPLARPSAVDTTTHWTLAHVGPRFSAGPGPWKPLPTVGPSRAVSAGSNRSLDPAAHVGPRGPGRRGDHAHPWVPSRAAKWEVRPTQWVAPNVGARSRGQGDGHDDPLWVAALDGLVLRRRWCGKTATNGWFRVSRAMTRRSSGWACRHAARGW